MKNLRMKNGFNRLGDADLCVKAGAILTSLTDNPHFPAPYPSLTEVADTLTAYSTAVQKAADKGLQQIAEKNQLKGVLISQLHNLSNYVLHCAAGNAAVAITSGFTIGRPRQLRPPLTVPENLVLTNGISRGELLLKLKRVANVQGYLYEITPHPSTTESEWERNLSTVSKFLFTGLVSGKEYCCRVAAIGIKEQVVYSEVVSRIAL